MHHSQNFSNPNCGSSVFGRKATAVSGWRCSCSLVKSNNNSTTAISTKKRTFGSQGVEFHPNRSAISTPRPGRSVFVDRVVVVVWESPPGRSSNPARCRPSGSPCPNIVVGPLDSWTWKNKPRMEGRTKIDVGFLFHDFFHDFSCNCC